jgi:hypothetical protein
LKNGAFNLHESPEVFDFEFLPESILDDCFRIEVTGTRKTGEIAGGVQKEGNQSIWISRKVEAAGVSRMDKYLDDICNLPEQIEAELLKEFKGKSFDVVRTESHDIDNEYLVLRMDCQVDYEVIHEQN